MTYRPGCVNIRLAPGTILATTNRNKTTQLCCRWQRALCLPVSLSLSLVSHQRDSHRVSRVQQIPHAFHQILSNSCSRTDPPNIDAKDPEEERNRAGGGLKGDNKSKRLIERTAQRRSAANKSVVRDIGIIAAARGVT